MARGTQNVSWQALDNLEGSPEAKSFGLVADRGLRRAALKENGELAGRRRLAAVAGASLAAEMAIAHEVQRNLFPQRMPPLKTLDYAGLCMEARDIGGDYYDFLDIGRGRVGFALADVSGKGVSAALLMAHLQASLRSQFSQPLLDLATVFRCVNRLFRDSVACGFFATLFFAEYVDATRTLRYVNCGHDPAFLVRPSGHVVRLDSTATVLGVFEEWDCRVGEAQMSPGDIFVMYSDGVTETRNQAGEFFGEGRLLGSIRTQAGLPAADITRAVARTAHKFGGNAQEDDLTVVVACAR